MIHVLSPNLLLLIKTESGTTILHHSLSRHISPCPFVVQMSLLSMSFCGPDVQLVALEARGTLVPPSIFLLTMYNISKQGLICIFGSRVGWVHFSDPICPEFDSY